MPNYIITGEQLTDIIDTLCYRVSPEEADGTIELLRSLPEAREPIKCEWIHDAPKCPESAKRHHAMESHMVKSFTHCPYCGKPITTKPEGKKP